MARIAYVNRRYVPHQQAYVHVEDRGYQFADGVYEVIAYYNHVLIDGEPHIRRLSRSLKELGIPEPMSERALAVVLSEVIARNPYRHGSLYIQVTRGVAKRDHLFPAGAVRPSLVVVANRERPVNRKEVEDGVSIIIRPDNRWQRRDIKSVGLLPNVLMKNEAQQLRMREVWLHDADGMVNEGAVSNAFIVKNGVLVTRDLGQMLLGGITRWRVLELARELGIPVELRPFSVEEAKGADEAFITSSTSHMVPVVKMEGQVIGKGRPGEVFGKLWAAYVRFIADTSGQTIYSRLT